MASSRTLISVLPFPLFFSGAFSSQKRIANEKLHPREL
jgi:hypothetical protein